MARFSKKYLFRFALACVAAVLAIVLAAGQTPQKKKKAAAPKKSLTVARPDSLARADSLRQSIKAKAMADSLLRAGEASKKQTEEPKKPALRVIRNEAFGVGERLVFEIGRAHV